MIKLPQQDLGQLPQWDQPTVSSPLPSTSPSESPTPRTFSSGSIDVPTSEDYEGPVLEHAIECARRIKIRCRNDPDTYKQFLKIFYNYRSNGNRVCLVATHYFPAYTNL